MVPMLFPLTLERSYRQQRHGCFRSSIYDGIRQLDSLLPEVMFWCMAAVFERVLAALPFSSSWHRHPYHPIADVSDVAGQNVVRTRAKQLCLQRSDWLRAQQPSSLQTFTTAVLQSPLSKPAGRSNRRSNYDPSY